MNSLTLKHQNASKDTITLFLKSLSFKIKAYALYQKVCISLLTNWQPSRELTSWAFWQERIEPAKFSITHTAESSMKKVIWKQTKQEIDYSLGETQRKNYLAFKKLSDDLVIIWITFLFSRKVLFIKISNSYYLKSNKKGKVSEKP